MENLSIDWTIDWNNSIDRYSSISPSSLLLLFAFSEFSIALRFHRSYWMEFFLREGSFDLLSVIIRLLLYLIIFQRDSFKMKIQYRKISSLILRIWKCLWYKIYRNYNSCINTCFIFTISPQLRYKSCVPEDMRGFCFKRKRIVKEWVDRICTVDRFNSVPFPSCIVSLGDLRCFLFFVTFRPRTLPAKKCVHRLFSSPLSIIPSF